MYCVRLQREGDDNPFFESEKGEADLRYFEIIPRKGELIYLAGTDLFYEVIQVIHQPYRDIMQDGKPLRPVPWSTVLIIK